MCPDLSLAQQLISLGPPQFRRVSLCLQAAGYMLVSGDYVLVLLQRQAQVGDPVIRACRCCITLKLQVRNNACLIPGRPAAQATACT